jgi:predicted kinase
MLPTDKKIALVVLVGAPGSGKSTFGKKFSEDQGLTYISSDELRARFGSGEEDQSVSGAVFAYIKRTIPQLLSTGKSVVIDATSMSKKDRSDYVKFANDVGAYKIAITFEVDRNTLLKRNQDRGAAGGRNVPVEVIDRMLAKYQRPDSTEFDKVVIK